MITEKHRVFIVNGKMEFAWFYDDKIKDKKQILDDFLDSKDWKSYLEYNKVKIKSANISKDLKTITIEVEANEFSRSR